jgi:predicted nuclease with TOPRIM domain
MRESMQHQLQEQARAIGAANQRNIELQEEVVRLNEKLANQEAESETRLEEKLQQFKEEESNKLQALRKEFMAVLAGSRGTPLVQVKNYLDVGIPMMVLECDLISSFHYLFICRLP